MNKKELLGILKSSTLSCNFNSLYVKYLPLIEATLKFCPDKVSLDGLASLDGISTGEAFERFIRENGKEIIEDKLKAVLNDLDTLSKVYSKTDDNKSAALAVYNGWLECRQEKNHKYIFPVFVALFILFSAVAAVFAFLDNFEIISYGGKIAGAAGILDFINGAAFFVYERIDDRKKGEIKDDFNALSGNVVIHKNNKIKFKGNNYNFGVINGGKNQTADVGEAVDNFILKYGNKIKFKGDDNNFGIKN